MSRTSNPFFVAPSNGYDAVGQGITNLASAFMSQPSAVDTAKTQALAWQARGARQEQEQQAADQQEKNRLANLFELHDPSSYDARQVLATGLRAGMDQGDLAQLFLTASGNLEGMTDTQRAGALVGTGRALGKDTAVSLPHQQRLRSEDRTALGNVTRDEALANVFLQEGPEAAASAREALYGPEKDTDQFWLNQSRQADVEASVLEEVNAIPADLGLPEGTPIPPELRAYILPEAMTLVQGGVAPRTAVAQVLQRLNVGRTDNWIQDDTLTYDLPSSGAPAGAAPSAAPPAGTVVDGYIFRGGDPNNAANWSPLNG